MKKGFSTNVILLSLLVLLAVFVAVSAKQTRGAKTITVELHRKVVSPWTKFSKDKLSSSSFCFSPKDSRPKRPLIFKTPMPTNCTEARVARISEECVFKNLAYTVEMVYPESTYDENSDAPSKKNKKNTGTVRLALDLSSPWSWIKSPVCQTCDRSGKNCKDKCAYQQGNIQYNRTIPCENCDRIQKCGEIDSYAEGMTVVGQFVVGHDMVFQNTTSSVGDWKFLWAHALSGQDFLQADGVLGLGIEENLNSKTLQTFNGKPTKVTEVFRQDDIEDQDKDEFSDEEDEDDDDNWNDDYNRSSKPKSETSLAKFDFFEPEMNLINHVMDSNKNIKAKIFSLYIADDDKLKYQMIIGEPQENYIYNPKENKIKYLQSMVSNEMVDQYGLWVVKVQTISIARLTETERKRLNEGQKYAEKQSQERDAREYLEPLTSLVIDNHKGILSLTTTALVLPSKQLKVLLDLLKNEYNLECSAQKEYLYFVICDNITSPKDELSDMTMIIEIGYHSKVYLQVNPADLLLNCKKKQKSSKTSLYTCQMNLQESYDDKIILGEAVLRNQYLVFNQQQNMIGFAPAKNTFNNASFVKRIEHLFLKVEEVIEQDIGYIIAFLLLMIISATTFLYFRHGPTIIALLKGKRVIIVDGKNDHIALSTSANETMDEQDFNELQETMQREMRDSSLDASQVEEKPAPQIDLADF